MNSTDTPTIARALMEERPAPSSGPLKHLSEAEIEHLLRGFPSNSIAGALALRNGTRVADFEACLFGILVFYRPPGTDAPDGVPSGDMRLHEDLGLDSMSMSEAMFKIEELFDISIENAELAEVATIADARLLLIQKLKSSSLPEPGE